MKQTSRSNSPSSHLGTFAWRGRCLAVVLLCAAGFAWGEEAPGTGVAEAVERLERFQPSGSKEEVLKWIGIARREGRTTKPVSYLSHAPYTSGAVKREDLEQLYDFATTSFAEVAVFRLRKFVQAEPRNAALHYLLGLACSQNGKLDEAIASLLEAIHLDEGRTTVTIDALRRLAFSHRMKVFLQRPSLEAAHCYAAVLMLDPANPQYAKEAAEVFKEAGLAEKAKSLLEAGAGIQSSSPAPVAPATK